MKALFSFHRHLKAAHSWLLSLAAVVLMLTLTSADTKRPITIFMIGDSTMANKPLDGDNQERGWGQMLSGFFTDDIRVDNHALNGRSSLSFILEGEWQKVYDAIQPGDSDTTTRRSSRRTAALVLAPPNPSFAPTNGDVQPRSTTTSDGSSTRHVRREAFLSSSTPSHAAVSSKTRMPPKRMTCSARASPRRPKAIRWSKHTSSFAAMAQSMTTSRHPAGWLRN